MKQIWLLAACASLACIANQAHAGKYADAAGIYLASPKGECKSHKMYGKYFPDQNISGVCVPITTLMNEKIQPILRLGIVELTNPKQLEAMERLEILRHQPTEAYKVEVDSFNDGIFKLVDGSILEKTGSGYVGYIGYHEEAILYRDTGKWKLCVNDSSYDVDILKNVQYHYSRDSLRASVAEIEKMDECE